MRLPDELSISLRSIAAEHTPASVRNANVDNEGHQCHSCPYGCDVLGARRRIRRGDHRGLRLAVEPTLQKPKDGFKSRFAGEANDQQQKVFTHFVSLSQKTR